MLTSHVAKPQASLSKENIKPKKRTILYIYIFSCESVIVTSHSPKFLTSFSLSHTIHRTNQWERFTMPRVGSETPAPSSSSSMASTIKAYTVPLILFVAAMFYQLFVIPKSFPVSHYDGDSLFFCFSFFFFFFW